jgi:hypothetical protein
VHDSVLGNFKSELVVLLLGGQYAIDEEVSGFEVIGFYGQLLDRVSSELMTLIRINRTSMFWNCPTYSGELGLLVLAVTADTRSEETYCRPRHRCR